MDSNNRFLRIHGRWQLLIIIVWILVLMAFLESVGYLYFKFQAAPSEGMASEGYADKSIYTYYPYIAYRYQPNAKDVRKNLDTDKMGFIHNGDPTRDLTTKKEGTYRIFILGGSTVAGTYSTPQTTISGYLEKKLNEGIRQKPVVGVKQVEVINSGVSGYNSSQELNYMIWYLMQLKPDQFVVLDGFNDFFYGFSNDGLYMSGENPYHQTQYNWLNSNVNIRQSVLFMVNYAANKSYFLKIFSTQLKKWSGAQKHVLESVAPPFYVFNTPHNFKIDGALKSYQNNLRTMIGVANSHGVGISVFFQPSLTPWSKKISDAERSIIDDAELTYSQYSSAGKSFFQIKNDWFDSGDKILNQIQGEFSTAKVRASNLAQIFKNNSETLYGDHCHYTDAGNKIIADAMLASVMSVLKNSVKK